jgi:hypothetical protein
MFSYSESIFLRVPSTETYIVKHIYCLKLLCVLDPSSHRTWHDSSASIKPSLTTTDLSSLFMKPYFNRSVCVILHINHMSCWIVGSRQDLRRIRGDLEIELIKDCLTFVYFAQFLLQVVGHVVGLHWNLLISDVPDVDRNVVPREYEVVVLRGKLGPRYRINNISEEMLPWWVFFDRKLSAIVWGLRVESHIAKT